MGNKNQHLELIQGVINRMANNSFALKGWAVTLVAGLFVLASKEANYIFFLIAYIPILFFWGLDSYYLLQERLYRALYDKVRCQDEDKIDFDLNAHKDEFKTDNRTWWNCFSSKTELWFYLPLAIVNAIVIILSCII